MTSTQRTALARRRPALSMQHGFGLVELMVAIVVGMLAILVIYQTFAVSEGYRRNTVGASDAQQGGLFSMLTTGIDLANAGNAPAVKVAPGPTTTSSVVTVTVFWQLPGEQVAHNFSTSAVIGRNP